MKPDHLCRVGKGKAPSKAGAISRCKSGPGKAQQAAWKRVLREAAAMPNTKRTQRLRGVCDGAPKYPFRWGRRLSFAAERHMGRTVMRGTVHPAGVEEHITRKRIASELGRSHVWPSIESSLSRTAVRIGKARSRSR